VVVEATQRDPVAAVGFDAPPPIGPHRCGVMAPRRWRRRAEQEQELRLPSTGTIARGRWGQRHVVGPAPASVGLDPRRT
jgi:hypothetical protein